MKRTLSMGLLSLAVAAVVTVAPAAEAAGSGLS